MSEGRILHLEDDALDAELVRAHLAAELSDLRIDSVASRAEYEAAIDRGDVKLILSDYTLPDYNGLAALELARSRHPDVPFIMVTGSLGEEPAVEILRKGATDYILKTRLGSLASAAKRAMQGAESRAKVKYLEEQLMQSQKLEALGELAAGIAHEIANPLSGILGLLELVKQTQTDQETMQDLETIDGEVKRCTKILRNLLGFARPAKACRIPSDPREIIQTALSIAMMAPFARHRIEVVREFGDLPLVPLDPSQMEQVFMNLITNAVQAMLGSDGLEERRSGKLIIRGWAADGLVFLQFSDNGPGIPEEKISKVFEPFFTTKEQGTGLGLSVSYGIVREHGGRIRVANASGGGAIFTVELPIGEVAS